MVHYQANIKYDEFGGRNVEWWFSADGDFITQIGSSWPDVATPSQVLLDPNGDATGVIVQPMTEALFYYGINTTGAGLFAWR